jgi:hypothetical protein
MTPMKPIYTWFSLAVGVSLVYSIIQVMFSFAAIIPNYSYFNYWQYFTTQSNTICALFILYRWSPFFQLRPMSSATYESLRGALVLFMSQTTFVYWAVLHGIFVIPDKLTFATVAYLHSGAFVYFLIDYAIQPPTTRISMKSTMSWISYPLLYAIYTFTMAQFRSWFPYPFMDPKKAGSVTMVVVNQLVLLSIMLSVAMAVRWLHNRWYQQRLRLALN